MKHIAIRIGFRHASESIKEIEFFGRAAFFDNAGRSPMVIAISSCRAKRAASFSENALDEFVCAPEALAKAFIRLTTHVPLDRLSRYEHMLWRQVRQLVGTPNGPKRRF